MKRRQWRRMKYCRRQRQYQEMSARFTHITGSVGFAGLHLYIRNLEDSVGAIEQAADDPRADLDALSGHLERVAGGTELLEGHLAFIRNSIVRYVNAFEEISTVIAPPRPRMRLEPGSPARWRRKNFELPPGTLDYLPGNDPAAEGHS